MHKKLINKFFKEIAEVTETPSAAALANFQIKLLINKGGEEVTEMLNDVVFSKNPTRKEEALAQREEIQSMTCEQLIKLMRGKCDPANQAVLVERATEFEGELIPEVIRMYKRSLNTDFIETSARVLSACSLDIGDELVECFDEIRSPYAQSVILVVLGFKADEKHIPWLIEKYSEFKRKYPDELYHDGAYYAISEIEERFYL